MSYNELINKWEVEFKKGFAKPLILLSLSAKPNYPYNLTRELNARTAGQINIAGSNIYPLLSTLKKQGLVQSEKVPKETNTESSSPPQMRTVYSLTEEGKSFLAQIANSMFEFLNLIEGILEENKEVLK